MDNEQKLIELDGDVLDLVLNALHSNQGLNPAQTVKRVYDMINNTLINSRTQAYEKGKAEAAADAQRRIWDLEKANEALAAQVKMYREASQKPAPVDDFPATFTQTFPSLPPAPGVASTRLGTEQLCEVQHDSGDEQPY